MLPLPLFRHHRPRNIDDVVALLAEYGSSAKLIAGGTDLLPNMKHGLFEPDHVISLADVNDLRGIVVDDRGLHIKSMTSLAAVAADERVVMHAPALAQAAGAVGGPHHRRMGTLGGNICLDTRCVYYNQTHFWREALGYCLKKDGTACHVVTSGKKCVAAASNDTAPALIALQADIELRGPDGRRRVAACDFYTTDGIYNTVKRDDELLTSVTLPLSAQWSGQRHSAFDKLRRRGAIDFPLLNTAARLDIEDNVVRDADLVVSALAARPKRVKAIRKAIGQAPSESLWDSVAEAAYKQCRPLTNIDNDAEWRHEMVRVLVARVLRSAASGGGVVPS